MHFLLQDKGEVVEEGFNGFGLFPEDQDEDYEENCCDEDSTSSSSIDHHSSATTIDPVILSSLSEADSISFMQSTVDDGNSATSDKG